MLRRHFIKGMAVTSGLAITSTQAAFAQKVAKIATLENGAYIWKPELSPFGPVVIVVSLPEQLVHVYRNGIAIGVSTCSTGRPGHRTPAGVFTILQKARKHYSSTYNNAPMPNMQRLTWQGVAMHAGHLPGYPASHGCIRLPTEFSNLLFGITDVGTTVIIANERSKFNLAVHPDLILDPSLAKLAAQQQENYDEKKKRRKDAWGTTVEPNIATVIVSAADQKAYLMVDGKLKFETPIRIKNPRIPVRNRLYSLVGWSPDKQQFEWHAYGADEENVPPGTVVNQESDAGLSRIVFLDSERTREVAQTLQPGTTLILTRYAADPSTRSDPDFTIMTEDKKVKGHRRK